MKVILGGGIGNQLFQISYGLKIKSSEIIITENISFLLSIFLNWSSHKQWLDVEAIAIASGIKVKRSGPLDWAKMVIMRIRGPLKGDEYIYRWSSSCFGYFQTNDSQKIEIILQVANLICKTMPLSLIDNHYGALHMRGGDFVGTNRTIASMSLLRGFENHLANKKYLVTNDIKQARKITKLNDRNVIFQCKDELNDFQTLACAKYLYVSESTFNFWAAACGLARGSLAEIYIDKDNVLYDLYKSLVNGRVKLITL